MYSGTNCVLHKGLGQMVVGTEGILLPGPCNLEGAVPTWGRGAFHPQ